MSKATNKQAPAATKSADAVNKAFAEGVQADLAKNPSPSGADALKAAGATVTAPKSSYGAGILSRGNTYRVASDALVIVEGWNARRDMGDIPGFAQYLIDGGEIPALVVKRIPDQPGKFKVVAGHRRTAAIRMAEGKGHVFPDGIEVKILDKTTDEQTEYLAMFNENQQKPFLPFEEAEAFKHMKDVLKMTLKEIAKRTGRGTVNVQDRLSLLELEPTIRAAAEAGEVNISTAQSIARQTKNLSAEEKAAEQAKLLEKAKQEGNSAVKASEAVGKMKRRKVTGDDENTGDEIKRATEEQLVHRLKLVSAEAAELAKTLGLEVNIQKLTALAKQDDHTMLAFRIGAMRGIMFALGQTKGI